MKKSFIRHISLCLAVLAGVLPLWAQQDDFDPVLPPDPAASYVVSVASDPAHGAAVTGSGAFNTGAATVVSCTPNEGYVLDYWTLDGARYGTDASFTYKVEHRSVAFVAHLRAVAAHKLSVTTNLTGATEVTGAGEYYAKHEVQIRCTPNKDYHFQYWTLNGEVYSRDLSFTYEMGDGDAAFVAVFTHTPHYTVTAKPDDTSAGRVTAVDGEYLQGDVLNIEAAAYDEYVFSHWTLNGTYFTDQRAFTYTVGEADAAFVAVFDFNPAQPEDPAVVLTSTVFVKSNPTGAATFNIPSGNKYREGDTLVIRATMGEDYIFEGWYEGDRKVASTTAFTYIVGQKSVTFTLRATPIIYSQLNLVALPAEAITFNIHSGNIYREHTTVALHASVAAGYVFRGWYSGDSLLSETTDLQYTIGATATTLTAKATIIEPDPDDDWDPLPPTDPDMESVYIIAQSANSATGKAYGSASYVVGKEATLRAVSAHGYVFSRWDDGNTDSVRTVVAKVNVTYTAYFTPITYTVNVVADDDKAGTVTGGGTYAYRSSATLTAMSAAGYAFVRWSDDNADATHTVYITSDTTFTAYFRPLTYTIDVQSSDMYAGIVTGGGEYRAGDSLVIKAASLRNNVFLQWDDGNADNPRTVKATGNTTYIALFVEWGEESEDAGLLQGRFKVAENRYVSFSQGNLQYIAGDGSMHACADWSIQPGTWRFADNQYAHVGTDNDQASEDYEGAIDIFGWGTSGWRSGAKAYQPWSASLNNADYQPIDATSDLTDAAEFADWGVYNAVWNGGNRPELWRVLTDQEWIYLFQHTRWTMARVNVNGKRIRGFMLLPDGFKAPAGVPVAVLGNGNETTTLKTISQAAYASNQYTEEQFAVLQQSGAVFLPCAGYRDAGEVDYVNMIGGYWSSTAAGAEYARGMYFFSSTVDAYSLPLRSFGYSVRLVRDVEAPVYTDAPSEGLIDGEKVTKILRDGQVIILREGREYTVWGVERR